MIDGKVTLSICGGSGNQIQALGKLVGARTRDAELSAFLEELAGPGGSSLVRQEE